MFRVRNIGLGSGLGVLGLGEMGLGKMGQNRACSALYALTLSAVNCGQ